MKVLIIEDELRLGNTLKDLLELNGFSAVIRRDGSSGLDEALTGVYDVILLDVMLPKMDGFSVLKELRSEKITTPVLMLTARSELEDRVRGLDSGADYYLTKPFAPQELLACIRALTRRRPELMENERPAYGDLTLENGTLTVVCGNRTLKLSRKEYDMLEYLVLNEGQTVTKEQLLSKVWGFDSDAEENNVEVYVSFLRKKLDHLHSCVKIRTVRMVGYHLEIESSL